jgi:hypothetical protein
VQITGQIYCAPPRDRFQIWNLDRVAVLRACLLGVEPVRVNTALKPDKSVTFKSGTGAASISPLTLTRQHIYNNDVGRQEGARVGTSIGRFIDRC